MYAVIKTGGKQYRIKVGETLKVEQLEVESGSELIICLLYTSQSPRDRTRSRMPSSA